MSDEDLQLIERCVAGQTSAFGQLVEKYQGRLYHSLVHLIGSPEEALDVSQEAFVQAFVKLKSFQGNSAFYTWLYRIAFNTAVSRRRQKRPTISMDQTRDTAGFEPADAGCSPESRLEQQERVTQIRAGLDALTHEHREILVLKDLEGYRYEEIAQLLQIPVGTVRSRLFRARAQLKEKLKPFVQDQHP